MDKQKHIELTCQKILREEYQSFRKKASDPFFISNEIEAFKAATQMLAVVRNRVEEAITVPRGDNKARATLETILSNYLVIGRRYALNYWRKRNAMREK